MPTPTAAELMAHARAAMLAQAVTKAHERATTLGIELSPEQAQEAGARIMKQAQRERMAVAREKRWTSKLEEKRVADMTWGVEQVLRYADTCNAIEPTIPDRDVVRILTMALADEANSPDGFSRPRLIRRLQAFVDRARLAAEQRSAELSRSLVTPVDHDDLPTLDDVLLESGEGTWSGLTDGDVR